MGRIIVILLMVVLMQHAVFGQEDEIDINKVISNKLVGIPKVHRKSFAERVNLYLESIKIHNSSQISDLLGLYFKHNGKRVKYSAEEKQFLIDKLNTLQILSCKITDIAYSSRNYNLSFKEKEWYILVKIIALINNETVEKKYIFIAYRQDNQWYFMPETIDFIYDYN